MKRPGSTSKARAKTGRAASPKKRAGASPPVKRQTKGASAAAPKKVVLLSGGNPQIAKGEGEAPVRAYIAAMPEWKRAVGEQVDALVVRSVPNVRKAVKWNSPFYGIEGRGWFVSLHVFTRFVRLAFFRGTSLRPQPPGASKVPGTRYFDIHEEDAPDEAQLASWMKQASALPGFDPGRPA
jgi:hypothetical protein